MSNEDTKQWEDIRPEAQMNVLTWGSSIYDSTYWDPLKRIAQGKAAGHAAFTIELPDVPENQIKFQQLIDAGYPGDIVEVPVAQRVTHDDGTVDYRNKKDEQGNTVKEKKLIIRFSPYFYSFGSIETESFFQKKAVKETPFDSEVFEKLKGTHWIQKDDLKAAGINNSKHLKKIMTQSDNIYDKKQMAAVLGIKDGTQIFKQFEKALARAYEREFKAKFESELKDKYTKKLQQDYPEFDDLQILRETNKRTKAHIKKMVDYAINNRQYSVFRKDKAPSGGPGQIIHLERMAQVDAQLEENGKISEAANMLYATYGQPPDNVDVIPFKTKQHQFGLDLDKLTDEMLRIKYQSIEKVHKVLIDKLDLFVQGEKPEIYWKAKEILNQIKGEDTNINDELTVINPQAIKNAIANIEKDLADHVKKNEVIYNIKFKEDPPGIIELMQAYQKIKGISHSKGEELPQAAADFVKLIQKCDQYAYWDDVIVQDAMLPYTFNCCATTKDCIRAGLDGTYKGYISESFLSLNSVTTPKNVSNEAKNLGDAIRRDRQARIAKDKDATFNTPPLSARLRGFGMRLRNNNFLLLPTRTIIRPIAIAVDYGIRAARGLGKVFTSVSKGITSIFSSKKEKISSLLRNAERSAYIVAPKDTLALLEKYLEYKKDGKAQEPFLIEPEVYNDLLNCIQSLNDFESKLLVDKYCAKGTNASKTQLEILFKCQYDQVSKDAFKAIHDAQAEDISKEVLEQMRAEAAQGELKTTVEISAKPAIVSLFRSTSDKQDRRVTQTKPKTAMLAGESEVASRFIAEPEAPVRKKKKQKRNDKDK